MYGHRIAEMREEKGWTQEELSAAIGISRASLSHYEKDRRKPNLETLMRLADIFHVSIDHIIGRRNHNRSESECTGLHHKD